jgi:HD-GYP domain-containing protein (c-di-GMP phosphodiesterase class II)
MTVCDVYDALTDERVYRGAFPPGKALEIIDHDTPAAFDERCVAILRSVLDGRRDRGRAPPAGAP